MSIQPIRIQRSRKKGSKLTSPNGLPVVCVTRPGKWGNPFPADLFGLDTALALYRETVLGGWDPRHVEHLNDELCEEAYRLSDEWRKRFRAWRGYAAVDALPHMLRGCNLACWCPLDKPCHADVLLELANA